MSISVKKISCAPHIQPRFWTFPRSSHIYFIYKYVCVELEKLSTLAMGFRKRINLSVFIIYLLLASVCVCVRNVMSIISSREYINKIHFSFYIHITVLVLCVRCNQKNDEKGKNDIGDDWINDDDLEKPTPFASLISVRIGVICCI